MDAAVFIAGGTGFFVPSLLHGWILLCMRFFAVFPGIGGLCRIGGF
jgi:hypothetical protein